MPRHLSACSPSVFSGDLHVISLFSTNWRVSLQADFNMKRQNVFQLRVRSIEKVPSATLDFFLFFRVVVWHFGSDLKSWDFFYVFCFLTENIKPEPTSMENVIPTPKSLRCWFSYAPIRVEIGPHRELEKVPEVGLSFWVHHWQMAKPKRFLVAVWSMSATEKI